MHAQELTAASLERLVQVADLRVGASCIRRCDVFEDGSAIVEVHVGTKIYMRRLEPQAAKNFIPHLWGRQPDTSMKAA